MKRIKHIPLCPMCGAIMEFREYDIEGNGQYICSCDEDTTVTYDNGWSAEVRGAAFQELILNMDAANSIVELVGRYWVDANNNRWSLDYYEKDDAEECSKSLSNCFNCTDCYGCVDCDNCFDCCNCIDCKSCYYCREGRSLYQVISRMD